MNILLCGSDGYIGRALYRKLLEFGHNVMCRDISLNPLHDIGNIPTMEYDIIKYNINCVVNLAAIRSVQECENKPLDYCIETNGIKAIGLYELAQKHNVKYVFTSTSAINEYSSNPIPNNYAASKRFAELHMPNAHIVRLNNVIGSYLGYIPHKNKSLAESIMEAIQGNKEIIIRGNAKRIFNSIDSVINIINNLITYNIPANIHHINDGYVCTTTELIKKFEYRYRTNLKLIHHEANSYDAVDSTEGREILQHQERYIYSAIESYGGIRYAPDF